MCVANKDTTSQLEKELNKHPCFQKGASKKFGRIHLPVAPVCNIQCRYCDKRYDCVNESRPGVTSKLMTPKAALKWVSEIIAEEPNMKVVGIAGPGDPLANIETLNTLDIIHKKYPELIKCISTNGLMLKERIEHLSAAGVRTITVTVNAVDPEIGSQIYEYVRFKGRTYRGKKAAALLWSQQAAGIEAAVKKGIRVKINTILIPDINKEHIPVVAKTVAELGVYMMNVMPLIPIAGFKDMKAPTVEEIKAIRKECERYLRQMDWCKQCRADAVGILGRQSAKCRAL
ncbi:MAG: nitrogenase cofactor biosynthesis protein NifB [Desulfotomaculum sp.]|nr:nitrogenase cofactor biosynthesis protein NifB [Desulfotomaculum sp.]